MLHAQASEKKTRSEHDGQHATTPHEYQAIARTHDAASHLSPSASSAPARFGAGQQTRRQAQASALQSAYGNQAVLRALSASGVSGTSGAEGGLLRRACSTCGGRTSIGEPCAECEGEEKRLRRSQGERAESATAPPIVHEVLKSSGRPLDQQTRAQMESRFGQSLGSMHPRGEGPQAASAELTIGKANDPHEQEAEQVADTVMRAPASGSDKGGQTAGYDFGRVRIHTGPKAAESARAVNALAYTVGPNIVFGDGQYAPESDAGKRLLAHELTHTIQQSGEQSVSRLQRDEETAPAEEEPTAEEEAVDEEGEEEEEEEGEDEVHDGDSEVPGLDTTPDPNTDVLDDSEIFGPEPDEMGDVTGDEEASAEEQAGGGGKKKKTSKTSPDWITHIDVDLTAQTMTLTFKNAKSTTHTVSTGKGKCGTKGDPCVTGNERNCTPVGTFKTSSRGDASTKNSHGDKMAWFVGLAVAGRSGIGIHNSQIANGRPMSHGCVRTGTGTGAGDTGWALAKKINQMVKLTVTDVTITGKAKTSAYPCPPKKKKTATKSKKKKK